MTDNDNLQIINLLSNIYNEIKSEADEGEYLEFEKTATTTVQTFYMIEYVGHPIRSYSIENTGTTNISFGHNGKKSKRYSILSVGEEREFLYNRKVITDIYIKTLTGNSTFVLTLMW